MSAWASTIAPTLTQTEARELTDQIVDRLAQLVPLVKRAYEGRADRALGYANWHSYCAAELGGIRIPLADRPTVVTELRREGMSTRAIGSALGVDAKTVRNDLASSGEKSPVETVISLDGRQRPATQPKPEPVDEPETVIELWMSARRHGLKHHRILRGADELVCGRQVRTQGRLITGQLFDPAEVERLGSPCCSACSSTGEPEMPAGQAAGDRIVDSIEQKITATREQRETIFTAQRLAKTLPGSFLEEVGVIVAGSRAGADVITPALIAALRQAVDVLEAEMFGREALGGGR